MHEDEALSGREHEILLLIAAGLSNQEIADRLFLTVGTVKWHNKAIFAKLGIKSRTQALVRARERGLLAETHRIPHHNLPTLAGPFVGREQEIAEILARLRDPACRLLTLSGLGGIGKTRLAVQAAYQCLDTFADGVYFCSVGTVTTDNLFVSAIAQAVQLSFSGHQTPRNQLLNYLRSKSLLLVIDNFEHLLDDSDLLYEVLEAAPQVKLLVTSRELLNMQAEWLLPIQGLRFPESEKTQNAATFPSLILFALRAQQVDPAFSLEQALEDVVRICQLVEGMPLALELAASWLRILTCSEVVERLHSAVEFLVSHYRDVPARHRSIRAVFDASWQLLSVDQQTIFRRLAVFRGEFDRAAAQAVTGAALPALAALVEKSLLYRMPTGRFSLHELLRQYAERRLSDDTKHTQLYEAHSTYYADFLAALYADVTAAHQREAERKIRQEIGNIWGAWQWAVDHQRPDLIQKAAYALYQYFRFNSGYREADEIFRAAAEALTQQVTVESNQALAELYCYRGWTRVRSGDLATAETLFEQSRTIYETTGLTPLPGVATDPLTGFGIIACVRGEYDEARRIGQAALIQNEKRGDPWNQVQAHYVLASAAFAQGDFDAAEHHARRAHHILDSRGERWMITYTKNLLGNIARTQGRLEQAAKHFHDSYTLYQEFDDREGIARTLNQMGQLAYLQRRYHQAQDMHLQSHRYYLDLGDQGGLGTALCGLGMVATALSEYQTALQYLQQALQVGITIQYMPLVCSVLISLGEVCIALGQPAVGVPLLGFVARHPACHKEFRDRITTLLEACSKQVPSESIHSLYKEGGTLDYAAAVSMSKAVTLPAKTDGHRCKP